MTTVRFTTVNILLAKDDSFAPKAKAIENINVTPSEKKSGNGAILATCMGMFSWKKFDITCPTNASKYVNKPLTTLADPEGNICFFFLN